MSANRLSAYQRITGILAGLVNSGRFLPTWIASLTVDPPENPDQSFDSLSISPDEKIIYYNREWVACQEDDQLRFALCALLIQKLFDHPTLRKDRDPQIWRAACNFVGSSKTMRLENIGSVSAPDRALYDPRFNGLDIDQVYEILFNEHSASPGKPIAIARIVIGKMVTSSKTSYFVTMINAKGQEWSLMETTNLDNALTEALEAADFFGIEPEPYYVDGVLQEPSFPLHTYRD